MSEVQSGKIYVTDSPGGVLFNRSAAIVGRSRTVVCKTGKQLDAKLASELPLAVLIDGDSIRSLPRFLEESFTQKTGRRFVPVAVLTDQPERSAKEFQKVHLPVAVLPGNDPEQISSFLSEKTRPQIRVKFWGVRGSTPCPNSENIRHGGNTSCVEIDIPGYDKLIILDSGTGIRNLGNYLDHYAAKPCSGDLFITHPHWDHIQGFPFFSPFYQKGNRFNIRLPEQYRGGARDILAGHLTKTFFPVTLDMFDAGLNYITQEEKADSVGPVQVDYLVANHPTKTAIYRFRVMGKTIIYAPDNELPLEATPLRFVERFCEFTEGCDLLIHDGQYNMDLFKTREGWGHSAWERTLELARMSGVKRLYLTHHDPDSSDKYLDELSGNLDSYSKPPFIELALAKEGRFVSLPVG